MPGMWEYASLTYEFDLSSHPNENKYKISFSRFSKGEETQKLNHTFKRLIIASEIDGGAEFLAGFLQRQTISHLKTIALDWFVEKIELEILSSWFRWENGSGFRQPGAYVILDPIRKMTNLPKVINIPGEKADLTATSVLLDLLNCDFKSWTNRTKNWGQKFWWQSNIKQMPSCPKNQTLCGNVTYLKYFVTSNLNFYYLPLKFKQKYLSILEIWGNMS